VSLSSCWKYDVPHVKCVSGSFLNKALKTETAYFKFENLS
jgi:hypothetical protein